MRLETPRFLPVLQYVQYVLYLVQICLLFAG